MEILGHGLREWARAFLLVYFGMLVLVVPVFYVSYPDVAERFLTFDPTQYIVYTVVIVVMFAFTLVPVVLLDRFTSLRD